MGHEHSFIFWAFCFRFHDTAATLSANKQTDSLYSITKQKKLIDFLSNSRNHDAAASLVVEVAGVFAACYWPSAGQLKKPGQRAVRNMHKNSILRREFAPMELPANIGVARAYFIFPSLYASTALYASFCASDIIVISTESYDTTVSCIALSGHKNHSSSGEHRIAQAQGPGGRTTPTDL